MHTSSHSSTTSSSLLTRYHQWRCISVKLWTTLLLGCVVLAGFRLALYIVYAPTPLDASGAEVAMSFWMGLRFDAKLFTTWLALVCLLSLIAWCLPRVCMRVLNALTWPWVAFGVVLINLFSMINHFYFAFYQSPINPLIFGFFEDDTRAIVATAWSDYPVIRLVAVWLGLSAVQVWAGAKLVRWLMRKPAFTGTMPRAWLMVVILLAQTLAFAVLARGSLGVFPLNSNGTAISKNTFVNQSVLCGGQALYFAWRDRASNRIDDNPLKGLNQLGFKTPQQAVSTLMATQSPTTQSSTTKDADAYLWITTPKRPQAEQTPPHVVFNVMESWGRHVLDYDDPSSNDLLGDLRPWMNGKADYFDKSVSSQNGTHASLEALLLDTPITPLTQAHGFHTYQHSVAWAYRKAGYRTIFLYAGSLHWRRLNQGLPAQGFDELYGAGAIQASIPEAEFLDWGVQDEYMFAFAKQLFKQHVEQKDTRPIFMVMLNSTNHPPFYPPAPSRLNPTDPKAFQRSTSSPPDIFATMLKTYQYANTQLGQFYQFLDDNGLLERTLLAASGDHNTHSAFIYPDNSQLQFKYGVPILMRIPSAYVGDGVAQVHTWAAHQDIFATLLSYSLSNTRVPRLGRNLYQPAREPSAISFIDGGFMISEHGAVVNFQSPRFYRWSQQTPATLEPVAMPSAKLLNAAKRATAWQALRDWRVRKQLKPVQRAAP